MQIAEDINNCIIKHMKKGNLIKTGFPEDASSFFVYKHKIRVLRVKTTKTSFSYFVFKNFYFL